MPGTRSIQFAPELEDMQASEPHFFRQEDLLPGQVVINFGPQHPSTHGVLRFEVLAQGEEIIDVMPHVGYLHRCFEKHAENLPYNQVIPFVDRMDYLSAMTQEHAYVMGVERMLGLEGQLPKRIEYIRVLVSELNRIASHFVAIGTYAMDIGAFTPFLWMMRDREHILRLLEWVSGARMLYNYLWVGGLFYDLPAGFEERCQQFVHYLRPKLEELNRLVLENKIFINRTGGVGALPLNVAVNYGCTGPVLRASGLPHDLRRKRPYSVYPELEFEVPAGTGLMGKTGDCWDRNWVRMEECRQSLGIIEQCLAQLQGAHARTPDFDPQALVPKKIRPAAQDYYVSSESARGEVGFYFRADGRNDLPFRCRARSSCFANLSVIAEISRGALVADFIAIMGSLDLVMGEVDR